MWPSYKSKGLQAGGVRYLLLFSIYLCTYTEAQIPSVPQIHFVPKTYFLQQQTPSSLPASEAQSESAVLEHPSIETVDITRTPRHLAPDRYYVGPSSVDQDDDQAATATTSLRSNTLDRAGNPINSFNQDLEQELKLDIRNNRNHYEAKILPNSQIIPRKSRGKIRRAKARPPKNVIIYSLPEQSFYAPPSNSEETYSSEPDSRESGGLRSDFKDEQAEQQQQQQQAVADSKEFRTTNSNLLSQKKALLGQCMAQCLDAIL